MNPLLTTSKVLRALHEGVLAWGRKAFEDAGLGDLVLRDAGPANPGATSVRFVTARVQPWPKLMESLDPQPLTGLPTLRPGSTVPRGWADAAALVNEALSQIFPLSSGAGRPARPLPWAPLDALPPGIRTWYEARGPDDGPEGWVGVTAAGRQARLPVLSWRPALKIRAGFRWDIVPGTAADAVPPLVVAGVLLVATHTGRTVTIPSPSLADDPLLASWLESIAAAATGEVGEKLQELVPALLAEATQHVAILPDETLPDSALPRQPSGPSIPVYAQASVGGGPILGGVAAPSLGSLDPLPQGGAS